VARKPYDFSITVRSSLRVIPRQSITRISYFSSHCSPEETNGVLLTDNAICSYSGYAMVGDLEKNMLSV